MIASSGRSCLLLGRIFKMACKISSARGSKVVTSHDKYVTSLDIIEAYDSLTRRDDDVDQGWVQLLPGGEVSVEDIQQRLGHLAGGEMHSFIQVLLLRGWDRRGGA